MPKGLLIRVIFIIFPILPIFGEYPLIRHTVKSRDPLYSQQQQDVEMWYTGEPKDLPLSIYRYIPRDSEDIFAVAAAFNLSYETLATLNRWDSPVLFRTKIEMLVPNIPGIFIPLAPGKRHESRIGASRINVRAVDVVIHSLDGKKQEFRFYPGEKFSAEERIRFLGSLFSSPLAEGKLSSGFGYRPSPFTGRNSFHPGIDFHTDIGTAVMAARDGEIEQTGTLRIYGNYIIIKHKGNYQTLYAHLNKILVSRGDVVQAGDTIALSGNSGISTGPHLHFEIRRDGSPIDPVRLTAL